MVKPEKYIIHNTTVKPPSVHKLTKKDGRTIQEKRGYIVQFADENGALRTVSPPQWGANPAIVDNINQGLLNFHREGLIKIEKIPDIAATLGSYTEDPAKHGASLRDEALIKELKEPKSDTKVYVAPMGAPIDAKKEFGEDAGHGYPGAKNPDGKDNFTVVAKPKSSKNTRRADVTHELND